MAGKWNKARAQRAHAKARAAQRYNLRLNRSSLRLLVQAIQANKAQFLWRESNRVTVWDIEFAGTLIRVVYDSFRKTIVTCLPRPSQEVRSKKPGSQ